MLIQERVLELFDVDLESGTLIRKKAVGRAKAGVRAGYLTRCGYRIICIDRVDYFEHNLIWFMAYGSFLELLYEIDHVDRYKANNAISNLRMATRGQNNANQKLRCDNSTGIKGVYRNTKTGKYVVQITVKRVIVHQSTHADLQEAAKVAKEVHEEHWGAYFNPTLGVQSNAH